MYFTQPIREKYALQSINLKEACFNLPSAAAAVLHDGILYVGGVGVEESVARVWILVLGLKKESVVKNSGSIHHFIHTAPALIDDIKAMSHNLSSVKSQFNFREASILLIKWQ